MADNEIRGKIKSYFTTAVNRDNLTSGEELPTSLGKIKKWFSDLKSVAFSGSYNDLTNKPTIPSTASDVGALPNNATVAITGAANGSGTFSNGTASIATSRRACNVGNTTSTAAPDKPWYLVADYVVPASNNNINRITFLVQTGNGNTVARMNNVGILDVLTRINVNGTYNTLRANWILSGYSINTNDFVVTYNSTSRKISLYAKITESYSTYRFVVLAESSDYNNVDVAELWTLYNTRTGGENNLATLPPDSETVVNVTSTLATLEAGTVYMDSPEIDRTAATLEADVAGTGRFILRDKNNKQIGLIQPSRLTDGRERLYITVNSEKDGSITRNALTLDIAPDGTCSYSITDPEAFRDAIDAAYTEQVDQILEYGGYNLLPIENITADSGIVYTVDKNAGTITVTSKGSSSMPQIHVPIPSELVGNYYFAVVGSSSTADAYVWCPNDSARAKKWDGTTNSAVDVGSGDCEIKLVSGKSYILQIRLRSAISGSLVFKPMVYSDKLKGIPFQPYAMSNLELTQKKVSISGDTITGSYNFKSTNIDRTQNPESTITADTNIKFTDTNNYQLGNITTQQLTDGRQRLYISTNSGNGSTMTTNHLSLYVDRDGNCSYGVGDKEAFRTAIDCPQNKQLTNENLNNISIPGFYNATSSNTCTNVPVAGAFGLLVIHTASGNYWKQYFFPITATAKPYFRSGNNGTWTAWKQISDISTTFYGTCSTAASSKDKAVTLSNSIGWQLTEGVVVGVKFTNSNTYTNVTDSPITLNVEGTGAKNIWYGSTHSGAGNTGTSTSIYGYAGRITYYMYDGTYWVWMGMSYLDGNTIPSAYCTTAASTAAKTASCTGYSLLANSYIHVLISNSNSAKSALTLSINNKTAKAIYINGTASSSSNYTLPAGTYLVFYDGTRYYFRTDGKITGNGWSDSTGNNYIESDGAGNVNVHLSGGTLTSDLTMDVGRMIKSNNGKNKLSVDNIQSYLQSSGIDDNTGSAYILLNGNLPEVTIKCVDPILTIEKYITLSVDDIEIGSGALRWVGGDSVVPIGTGTNLVIDSDGYIMKSSSSRTVKHDIDYVTDTEQFHNALMQMKPATFIYNSDKSETEKLGMIAEDVADVCPIAGIADKNCNVENYDDRAVIAMLVMEVQRLNKEIEKLRGEINGQA